jgi:magnesium transporter
MADAVGTQTEALVIRGFSVGIRMGRVVRRELITGVLVGLAIALVFYPIALWRWEQPDIALAISIALLFACASATVIAMALPWTFQALGRDPAFGSGPLATVIQDLLSILIYLAVASAIV